MSTLVGSVPRSIRLPRSSSPAARALNSLLSRIRSQKPRRSLSPAAIRRITSITTGTPVAAAIDTLAGRGGPVGGARAGNAVLAQFGYQRLRELAEPGGAVTLQTQVEILGRAGALCETQFHGDAALQIVAGKQPADCGALQDAAYCQIRYLSPQALLVQTLAARYAREGLFQPFRRTRSEAASMLRT